MHSGNKKQVMVITSPVHRPVHGPVQSPESRFAVSLALVGWAGRTVDTEHDLFRARATIVYTFERSENAAIALAHWAIEPLAKRKAR